MLVEMVRGERRVVDQPRLGGRVDVRLGGEGGSGVVREVSRAVRVVWFSFLESVILSFKKSMDETQGRGKGNIDWERNEGN